MATKPNLPDPTVHFDLDEAIEEHKKAPKKEPFQFNAGERVITMTDPEELDWREAALLDNPIQMLNLCMSKEDRDYLYQYTGEVPTPVFGKLVKAFSAYYGLEDKIVAAQRQARLEGLNQ